MLSLRPSQASGWRRREKWQSWLFAPIGRVPSETPSLLGALTVCLADWAAQRSSGASAARRESPESRLLARLSLLFRCNCASDASSDLASLVTYPERPTKPEGRCSALVRGKTNFGLLSLASTAHSLAGLAARLAWTASPGQRERCHDHGGQRSCQNRPSHDDPSRTSASRDTAGPSRGGTRSACQRR